MAAWQDITIAPAEAPTVTRCCAEDGATSYQLAFERTNLAVMLDPAELQELVARALVAQSDEPSVDLR